MSRTTLTWSTPTRSCRESGRRYLFFFCVCFAMLAPRGAGAAQAKRVLVVHSFGTVAPPFTIHSTAFETELVGRMGQRLDLDEVSLDMARYADPHLQEALVEYLQKRQAEWQPDLVVPIGSPAGVFVAQNRQRLFPNATILYCGMDQRRLAPDALEKNAAFVGENFDLPGFVEDILQVAPSTKNIAIVIGASPVERFWAQAFREALEPFADRVNFIWLNDLSFDQMLDRTSNLPPNSWIFLVLLLRDANGVSHNADEALQRMHAVANAPISGIFQHQLGLGIVGGRLYQAELEGVEAAHLAARILAGEPASSFPPKVVGPLPPRYDWRELQRWNIKEKFLPPGSTILFRSPTVWQRYQKWIVAGLSVLVLQALLIFGLLANLIKRRRAEVSLVESEARFKSMADAAPVLIRMSGPDQKCTFFNKEWLEFTGRKMAQELGDGWSEGIHPADLEECLKIYKGACDAREPFVVQYRLRNHSGQYRWLTDQGVPRYGPRGNFRGYVGACVDITDLLEKDRALRDIEERVALAAEVAHLGVWELDATTSELWISDSGRKLFGFEPDGEISYETFQDRVHPDDQTRRASIIKRAIETQGGYELEYRIVLPNGSLRWISGRGHCVSDKDGRLTRLVGVSMDTTDLKNAQQLFELATEASPSGIVLVDSEGRIVLVNAHVEELFGYGRDELIGKSLEVLVPNRSALYDPATRDEFIANRQASVTPAGRESFAVHKDGREFPVEIDLNPIETPQGSLVLTSILDISARKAAEEEAQRRRDEIDLLTRVSLLGEMTASIAHEVNQPLSGIISNAGAGQRFIDRGNVDPVQLREILVDIAADGRRAHDVIRNIRNTIKKGGTIRERLRVNDVISGVVRLVQPDATAYSCKVQTFLADDVPAVEGDPVQIQQVLVNLIGNAFDAMSATPFESRKVEVSAKRNGSEMIVVSVRDYGVGIAEEVRSHLFDQFFTTKPEGLGLGLAIVRSIIEAHAGMITVDNAEGGGARFSFTLPTSKEISA
jgi:PAS domain S-box-containing protein